MRADLHLHSYFSDGVISPRELIWQCKNLGLEIAALTDHETTIGLGEAKQAGELFKIRVIPGIEIAAEFSGREYHILGYLNNYRAYPLEIFLSYWSRTKKEQVQKMIQNLQVLGFSISCKEVLSHVRGSVNRAHIGRAVLARPENKNLLEKFGIRSQGEFFRKFLKEDGQFSVYVPRERPSVESVVRLIKNINGIAVWAHAFWRGHSVKDVEREARAFQEFGLDGLEVCYPFHTKEEATAMHGIAKKLSLIETMGSDFHSPTMDMLNKIADFQLFGLKIDFSWLKDFGG